MNINYPNELRQIPEEIIKRCLYAQADLVSLEGQNGYLEPVEWTGRYLTARQRLVSAENRLAEKMHEAGITASRKELEQYLMERAIFYHAAFNSKGLFPVTEGRLEFLIISTLKQGIGAYDPQRAVKVTV